MIATAPDRIPPGLRQFLTYTVCGATAAALDALLFVGLTKIRVFYLLANTISYGCGTLLSFILNRAFTFRVMDAPWRRLVTFFAVAGTGYLLSSASLIAMIEWLHWDKLIAKLASIVVVVLTQYTLNSRVTFKKTAQP